MYFRKYELFSLFLEKKLHFKSIKFLVKNKLFLTTLPKIKKSTFWVMRLLVQVFRTRFKKEQGL